MKFFSQKRRLTQIFIGRALREGITRNLREKVPYIISFIIYYLLYYLSHGFHRLLPNVRMAS